MRIVTRVISAELVGVVALINYIRIACISDLKIPCGRVNLSGPKTESTNS